MNLDIVLIDFLTPDGVLTSYRVKPKQYHGSLVVDRLRDISSQRFRDNDRDLGGTRIYNASICDIENHSARIRAFELKKTGIEQYFSFQFERIRVPIGPSKEGHGGIYNFVLYPGWRLRKIRIVDPSDNKYPSVESKDQFRYEVIWDTECNTQMVDMEMGSNQGSFSFIVAGMASLVATDSDTTTYVEASQSSLGIKWIIGHPPS